MTEFGLIDTADYDILLLLLETSFGIGGSVLVWLKWSLSDRQHTVCLMVSRQLVTLSCAAFHGDLSSAPCCSSSTLQMWR